MRGCRSLILNEHFYLWFSQCWTPVAGRIGRFTGPDSACGPPVVHYQHWQNITFWAKKKKSSMKPVFIHCWWLLTWYFMIFSQNVDIKPSIWDGRLNEPHMVMVGGRFWRWFGKYRRKNSDCKWAVMCRKMRWYYQFHAVLMNPRSVACSSAVADTGPLQHSGLIVKK